MRILTVASLSPEAVSRHRIDSMRRLGHQVEVLDCDEHIGGGSRIINWLRYRTMMGASIRALNRRLVALAKAGNFDLIWFDKPVYGRAGTVPALRRTSSTCRVWPLGALRLLASSLKLYCVLAIQIGKFPYPLVCHRRN